MLHTFDANLNHMRFCVNVPYGPEIESKSTGKYENLESAWASYLKEIGRVHFQSFKILLHTFSANLNHIEIIRSGPPYGLKLNPRAPESRQMSNLRGHHTYKKSEARIFKGFKIELHPFDANQTRKR